MAADVANVISTLLKLDGTQFKTGMKSAQQSIRETDGVVNKAKAGWSSLLAGFASSPVAIGAAATAVTGLALKSVQAFEETALSAGKLSDATGLAVEDASRLLEVSGDIRVSGETLTAVIKKMTVELGKGNSTLDEYGISLQHTSDGAADVNATLIDTIKRIGAIEDPTKRAEAAQAAFGRGYAQAAELIFGNADKLQQKLAEVSDAKIITPEELKRARDFRDAMENLKDVGQDLAVTTGQTLVPVLSDLATFLLQVKENADKAKGAIEDIPGGKGLLDALGTNIFELPGKSKKEWDDLGRTLGVLPPKTDDVERSLRSAIEAAAGIEPAAGAAADAIDEVGAAAAGTITHINAADESWKNYVDSLGAADALPGTFEDMAAAADAALSDVGAAALGAAADFGRAIQDMRDKVDFLGEAFNKLRDDLDLQDLLDNITDQFGKIAEAQKHVAEDGPEGVRNYNRAVRDLQRQLSTLVDSIASIPASKKVELLTEIERGSLDDLYRILGDLTKGITVPVSFAGAKIPGFTSAGVNFNPSAGTIAPVINGASTPVPVQLDQRQITYNFPVGTTPTTQYIDATINARRNGPR